MSSRGLSAGAALACGLVLACGGDQTIDVALELTGGEACSAYLASVRAASVEIWRGEGSSRCHAATRCVELSSPVSLADVTAALRNASQPLVETDDPDAEVAVRLFALGGCMAMAPSLCGSAPLSAMDGGSLSIELGCGSCVGAPYVTCSLAKAATETTAD